MVKTLQPGKNTQHKKDNLPLCVDVITLELTSEPVYKE